MLMHMLMLMSISISISISMLVHVFSMFMLYHVHLTMNCTGVIEGPEGPRLAIQKSDSSDEWPTLLEGARPAPQKLMHAHCTQPDVSVKEPERIATVVILARASKVKALLIDELRVIRRARSRRVWWHVAITAREHDAQLLCLQRCCCPERCTIIPRDDVPTESHAHCRERAEFACVCRCACDGLGARVSHHTHEDVQCSLREFAAPGRPLAHVRLHTVVAKQLAPRP
ncbi:hypothetical protein OAO87_03905 [bacterium]|nr:hypothetical protein [bacterium]